MVCFRLADRFHEPDVAKIASLPLPLIYAWLAYYEIVDEMEAERDGKGSKVHSHRK